MSIINSIRSGLHPIHKEGYVFIVLALIPTIIAFATEYTSLGWALLILTAWCAFFFRDPERVTPQNDNLVISPADGTVSLITKALPPKELNMEEKELTRISIFLNIFNVHVNRSPVTGTVKELHYHPGKFLNASLDKASEDNERQSVLVETANGKEVAFTQIAGLIAKRIVCDLEEKQEVKAGERYGIIRFGSRMDVFLPDGVNPQVVVGQTAIAGETILADLKSKSAAAKGKKH